MKTLEGKWTNEDLRTAFEDGCKFLHFKDLQDFLLKRKELGEAIESSPNTQSDKESESCCILHPTDWNGKCFKCGEQVFVRAS